MKIRNIGWWLFSISVILAIIAVWTHSKETVITAIILFFASAIYGFIRFGEDMSNPWDNRK